MVNSTLEPAPLPWRPRGARRSRRGRLPEPRRASEASERVPALRIPLPRDGEGDGFARRRGRTREGEAARLERLLPPARGVELESAGMTAKMRKALRCIAPLPKASFQPKKRFKSETAETMNPMHSAPRCGARTRQGRPCTVPAIKGKRRCRMHGGKSTGPRTPEGLQRSRRARWKHGRYSREARAAAREARWNDPGFVEAQRQAAMRRMERESKWSARRNLAAYRAALRQFGIK